MGDFKLTFGNVSNNQSISGEEIKPGFKKADFSDKIQQSIFTKAFDKNKDGKVDENELNGGFEALKNAAKTDGNLNNLSEDEALAFLAQYNIDDASAQDLFSFFNKAKTLSKKPTEKKVVFSNDNAQNLLTQNQQNSYFNKGLEHSFNMNFASGDQKVALYSFANTNFAKAKSYKPDKAQELINPQGDASVSAGFSTKVGKDSSLNTAAAAGQLRTSSTSMVSGGIAYSKETGDNASDLLNAYVKGQALVGDVSLSGTASVLNYQQSEGAELTRTSFSATASMPLKPVENSKVWHGGTLYASGEYAQSNATRTVEGVSENGSSTLIKGGIGANYNIGTGTFLGDINLRTNVSAFNLSDTGGTQIAGGASTPFGVRANFGQIPSYSGWIISGLDFNDINIYHNDDMSLKGNFSYSSNFYEWGAMFDKNGAKFKDYVADNAEYTLNTGATLHLNNNNSDIGVQYRHTRDFDETENDIQVYITQNFIMGDRISGRFTGAVGYNSNPNSNSNSNSGFYGQAGLTFNVGNPTRKPQPKQDNRPVLE